MKKKFVVFINPPIANYDKFLVVSGRYPALGILTLASAIQKIENIQPVYLDGMACPLTDILEFISLHKNDILAIGISALQVNYENGLKILEHSRCENPSIVHLIGNVHFSAIPSLCMQKQAHLLDYGFIGHDVVESVCTLISVLANNRSSFPPPVPGLIYYDGKTLIQHPQKMEALFENINYTLIDEFFNHSQKYDKHFQDSFSCFLNNFKRNDFQGVAVEVARGCIKFQQGAPCSFCSTYPYGLMKKDVGTGVKAWEILYKAFQAGYNFWDITADELPLTFPGLLRDMHTEMPRWFIDLPESKRPVLCGYARADGLAIEKNTRLLYDIGFRAILTGIEATSKVSLQALNKPLTNKESSLQLDRIYEANHLAFIQTAKVGLKLRPFYVLGHFGMTPELLEENVANWKSLIAEHSNNIVYPGVSLLFPEPGSQDFQCLIDPELAERRSNELNLSIASRTVREQIAEKWIEQDIIDMEEVIQDYVTAFMPGLSFELLKQNVKDMEIFSEHYLSQGKLRSFYRSDQ